MVPLLKISSFSDPFKLELESNSYVTNGKHTWYISYVSKKYIYAIQLTTKEYLRFKYYNFRLFTDNTFIKRDVLSYNQYIVEVRKRIISSI